MITTFDGDKFVARPRVYIPARPVIYSHTVGGSSVEMAVPEQRKFVEAVTLRGHQVIGHSSGVSWGTGGTSSGYAASGTIQDSLAASGPGKPSLIGVSMGTQTSLIYALENPTEVASISICAPALDLEFYYENDTEGLRASIGTLWGVTFPTPLPFEARIFSRAEEFQGIPIVMYYSPIDEFTTPRYEEFARRSGTQLVDVGDFLHDSVLPQISAGALLDGVMQGGSL